MSTVKSYLSFKVILYKDKIVVNIEAIIRVGEIFITTHVSPSRSSDQAKAEAGPWPTPAQPSPLAVPTPKRTKKEMPEAHKQHGIANISQAKHPICFTVSKGKIMLLINLWRPPIYNA